MRSFYASDVSLGVLWSTELNSEAGSRLRRYDWTMLEGFLTYRTERSGDNNQLVTDPTERSRLDKNLARWIEVHLS